MFSAAEAEGFDLGGRDQAIVCGIETHVCVNQTALDLLAAGADVQVAEDAVGSRFPDSKRIGLAEDGAGRGGADQRRDGAVRAAGPRRAPTSSRSVQKLILEYAPNEVVK